MVSTSAVDPLELHHPAEPLDEGHLDLDAVELEVVAVQDVGLDAALALAVEGRVGADRDGGGVALPVSSRVSQPAYTPSAGAASIGRGRHVGRRVAELAAALVALDDDAAHGEGAAQRLGRAGDVAGGQALADVGRAPDLRTTVERDPDGLEAARRAGLAQQWPRRRRPWRRSGSWHRPRRRAACSASTRMRSMNSCGDQRGDLAVEADHEDARRRRQSRGAARGCRCEVSVGGACSGRSTAIGCGSKVTATTVSMPRRAGGLACLPQHVACPRWTPSKLPMLTTVRPRSAGTSSKARQICTGEAYGDALSRRRRRPRRACVAALLVEGEELAVRGEERVWTLAGSVSVEGAADADVARPAPRQVDDGERRPCGLGDRRPATKVVAQLVEGAGAGRSKEPTAVRRRAVR